MRLIDAEKLTSMILADSECEREEAKAIMLSLDSVLELIDNVPAIDAEPVVRCGDCEHWNSDTKGCKRNPSVEAWEETDYCSYGESTEAEE